MQKFINAIAIASGVISLTVVGSGVVIYLQKDAIIENVKSKVMGSVLDSVTPDLGSIAGDSIPRLYRTCFTITISTNNT